MADDYPVDLSSRSFLFAFVSICKMAKIRLQGASSKITFSAADFGGSLSVCLFYHFNIDFFLDSLMVRWSPGHHGFQCIFFRFAMAPGPHGGIYYIGCGNHTSDLFS